MHSRHESARRRYEVHIGARRLQYDTRADLAAYLDRQGFSQTAVGVVWDKWTKEWITQEGMR